MFSQQTPLQDVGALALAVHVAVVQEMQSAVSQSFSIADSYLACCRLPLAAVLSPTPSPACLPCPPPPTPPPCMQVLPVPLRPICQRPEEPGQPGHQVQPGQALQPLQPAHGGAAGSKQARTATVLQVGSITGLSRLVLALHAKQYWGSSARRPRVQMQGEL